MAMTPDQPDPGLGDALRAMDLATSPAPAPVAAKLLALPEEVVAEVYADAPEPAEALSRLTSFFRKSPLY